MATNSISDPVVGPTTVTGKKSGKPLVGASVPS